MANLFDKLSGTLLNLSDGTSEACSESLDKNSDKSADDNHENDSNSNVYPGRAPVNNQDGANVCKNKTSEKSELDMQGNQKCDSQFVIPKKNVQRSGRSMFQKCVNFRFAASATSWHMHSCKREMWGIPVYFQWSMAYGMGIQSFLLKKGRSQAPAFHFLTER